MNADFTHEAVFRFFSVHFSVLFSLCSFMVSGVCEEGRHKVRDDIFDGIDPRVYRCTFRYERRKFDSCDLRIWQYRDREDGLVFARVDFDGFVLPERYVDKEPTSRNPIDPDSVKMFYENDFSVLYVFASDRTMLATDLPHQLEGVAEVQRQYFEAHPKHVSVEMDNEFKRLHVMALRVFFPIIVPDPVTGIYSFVDERTLECINDRKELQSELLWFFSGLEFETNIDAPGGRRVDFMEIERTTVHEILSRSSLVYIPGPSGEMQRFSVAKETRYTYIDLCPGSEKYDYKYVESKRFYLKSGGMKERLLYAVDVKQKE